MLCRVIVAGGEGGAKIFRIPFVTRLVLIEGEALIGAALGFPGVLARNVARSKAALSGETWVVGLRGLPLTLSRFVSSADGVRRIGVGLA